MLVNQVIEVALMPEMRVRAELRNNGNALQHRISDPSVIELPVQRIESMRHLADTLPVVSEALFETRDHPSRD